VGTHAVNFADAIKASMREDPDIILVGEMRDLETIYQAIKAAETGVLVMATLHTNNAAKTVDRIINVFPARQQDQIRSMIAESLRAVISQQLLKRIDMEGRVAALEILIATAGFGGMVRESKNFQIPAFIHSGMKEGMQVMDMALTELAQTGKISMDTAKELITDQAFIEALTNPN
jgi:twitching motility protein PilT